MPRPIDDKDYLNFLATPLRQRRHLRWRERMNRDMDAIIDDMYRYPIEEVMERWDLIPKDIALMVRLHIMTPEEVESFGLKAIEETVGL